MPLYALCMEYLFVREDCFYSLQLPLEGHDEKEVILAHVVANPGTKRVENLLTGEVIFEEKE